MGHPEGEADTKKNQFLGREERLAGLVGEGGETGVVEHRTAKEGF